MVSVVDEASFDSTASGSAGESTWVVLKFGGTSVSAAANWETIAGLVRNRIAAGLQPVVVHSALQGVSNSLQDLVTRAADSDVADELAAIRDQHLQLANELRQATIGALPIPHRYQRWP